MIAEVRVLLNLVFKNKVNYVFVDIGYQMQFVYFRKKSHIYIQSSRQFNSLQWSNVGKQIFFVKSNLFELQCSCGICAAA